MKHKQSVQGQRQLRVGEQIRHCLCQIMREGHFHDPALRSTKSITVTEVRISPDLKNATAFVMTLGGEKIGSVIGALKKTEGFFRKELGKQLNLRYIPKVHFEVDDSYRNVDHINEILKSEKVAKDLKKPDESKEE